MLRETEVSHVANHMGVQASDPLILASVEHEITGSLGTHAMNGFKILDGASLEVLAQTFAEGALQLGVLSQASFLDPIEEDTTDVHDADDLEWSDKAWKLSPAIAQEVFEDLGLLDCRLACYADAEEPKLLQFVNSAVKLCDISGINHRITIRARIALVTTQRVSRFS